MSNSFKNTINSKERILKIEPKSDGCYKVYFDFLNVPVEMNKGYLKTITSNQSV